MSDPITQLLRDARATGSGMLFPNTPSQEPTGYPQNQDVIPPAFHPIDFAGIDPGGGTDSQTADGAGWMPLKLCDGSTINVWAKQ